MCQKKNKKKYSLTTILKTLLNYDKLKVDTSGAYYSCSEISVSMNPFNKIYSSYGFALLRSLQYFSKYKKMRKLILHI